MTDHTPPTAEQLDEYEQAIAAYEKHPNLGFACCSAHPAADAGAALLAEVRRLRKQRKFLLDQIARKDAASGDGDRAVREFLSGVPEPTVQPTGYLVSCLPEGHDDRWTFTIQVKYTGGGQFAVQHGIREYGADGTWSYEPDHGEDDDAEEAWLAAHRFDHDTALRLGRELAPTLTYRGRSVADILAAAPAAAEEAAR